MPAGSGEGQIEIVGFPVHPIIHFAYYDGGGNIRAEGIRLEAEIRDRKGQAGNALNGRGGDIEPPGVGCVIILILAKKEEAAGAENLQLHCPQADLEAHGFEGKLHHRITRSGEGVGLEPERAGHRRADAAQLEAQGRRTTAAEEVGSLRRRVGERLRDPAHFQRLVDRPAGGVELKGEILSVERKAGNTSNAQFIELHPTGDTVVSQYDDTLNIGNFSHHRTDSHGGRQPLPADLHHTGVVRQLCILEGQAANQLELHRAQSQPKGDRAAHADEIQLVILTEIKGHRIVVHHIKRNGTRGGAGSINREAEVGAAHGDIATQAVHINAIRLHEAGHPGIREDEPTRDVADRDRDVTSGERGRSPQSGKLHHITTAQLELLEIEGAVQGGAEAIQSDAQLHITLNAEEPSAISTREVERTSRSTKNGISDILIGRVDFE